MIKKYLDFLNEKTSGQIFNPKRDEYKVIDIKDHEDELSDEFYELIKTAYSAVGGHTKIKSKNDVFSDPEWNYWGGIDIHGTPDFDIILFGQKTNYGIKYSGAGHDGENDSKRKYIEEFGEKLNTYGYYAEVSDKIGEILTIGYKVPIIDNQEDVERILGKSVNWIGEIEGKYGYGWYNRNISGNSHSKLLIGNPIDL